MDSLPLPQPPPPAPDISISKRLLIPIITFFTLTISLATLRLYTRILPRKQHPFQPPHHSKPSWDDLTLLLATAMTILQSSLLFAALPHGVGRHNRYVPYPDQVLANKFLLISQIPWGWSVALAKISIACLLLRLKSATSEGLWPWKLALYGLIVVSIVSAVSANVVQLIQCRPVAAIWDPSIPGASCLSSSIVHDAIYAHGAVAVLSDIFLAVVPISFLKNVRRSVRERAILIFLMGLAMFTAITTIVKMTLVAPCGEIGDGLWDSIDIVTCSCVEAYMGIIAASVPCLKSPFERFLRRVGVIKSVSSGSGSEGSGRSDPGSVLQHDMTTESENSHKHDKNYRLSGIMLPKSTGNAVGGDMRDVLSTRTATSSEQSSILDHGGRGGEMYEFGGEGQLTCAFLRPNCPH